jgi:hypothetical protein
MQLFIVILGALLFVFYQFQPHSPVVYNQTQWQRQLTGPEAESFRALEEKYATLHAAKQEKIRAWATAQNATDPAVTAEARRDMLAAQSAADAVRKEARTALQAADPTTKKTKDSDFVFIHFILTQLPHGIIGLLLAVMFASALSSKAGELNALGTTSTIDLWRTFRPRAVCEFRGKSHRGTQHRRLHFLSRAARRVRRGVLFETRERHRRLLGRGRGADGRHRHFLFWQSLPGA